MKHYLSVACALVAIALTASTCEKMEPGDYRDYRGNKINLLGDWALVEVQYRTAGVVETSAVEPASVMEFAPKGIGYTKTRSGEVLDTWHYQTYRAAVTLFTNAEWENNRSLGEDDPQYERGKTYYFHVIDDETLSSEEKVSSNSSIINIFRRVY